MCGRFVDPNLRNTEVEMSQIKLDPISGRFNVKPTETVVIHHPHIHMIVPGGGLSPDGTHWIACKPGFFLHVRVLSRLFRRLFLEGLLALHRAGDLAFFGDLAGLADNSDVLCRGAIPLAHPMQFALNNREVFDFAVVQGEPYNISQTIALS